MTAASQPPGDGPGAARVRCGDDRAARVHPRGTPIGPLDVLMAGQARGRGLILVTANTREFQRIEGLVVEDWSSPRS